MSTPGSALLRQARAGLGLSQRALAEAAEVPQSSIARVESGARGLAVDTLQGFLSPVGYRLLAVPTWGSAAASAALAVSDWLASRDEDSAFREVIQLSDDLAKASPSERVVLSFAPASSCGDARYDNLIAGLIEHYLSEAHAPLPSWVPTVAPLTCPWFVDPYTAKHPESWSDVPEPLRARNVFLNSSELASA